jgi:hypothetical protein
VKIDRVLLNLSCISAFHHVLVVSVDLNLMLSADEVVLPFFERFDDSGQTSGLIVGLYR